MEDVSYKNIAYRVKRGKEEEVRAIAELHKAGWIINVATNKEDRQDKIDCWVRYNAWWMEKQELSAQIKTRASGDDIIVEVCRPYVEPNSPMNQPGRDMKGSFDLYILVGRNGEPPVVMSASTVRDRVQLILQHWKDHNYDLFHSYKSDTYTSPLGMICIKKDNSDGAKKLLVFVKQQGITLLTPPLYENK